MGLTKDLGLKTKTLRVVKVQGGWAATQKGNTMSINLSYEAEYLLGEFEPKVVGGRVAASLHWHDADDFGEDTDRVNEMVKQGLAELPMGGDGYTPTVTLTLAGLKAWREMADDSWTPGSPGAKRLDRIDTYIATMEG